MMLNVQELSARLSMMADPALQQYAAMHKDDPYVLALAVSEANRRRQVRAAQQGAAGAQPQPTVADQEVAQMTAPVMPEQVGIGALPAPALAGMPAGGIVGEEEQAPQTMAGGGLVAFAGGGMTDALKTYLQFTNQMSAYTHGTPAERAAIEAAFRSSVAGPFNTPPTPGASAAPGTSVATPAGRALGLSASRLAGASVAGIPVGMAGALVSGIESMREQGYPVDMTAPEFATEATPAQLAFDEMQRQKLLQQRAENARISALIEGRPVPTDAKQPTTAFTRPAMANDPRLLGDTPPEETVGYANERARNMAIVNAAAAPSASGTRTPGVGGAPTMPGLDVEKMTARALKAAGEAPNPFAAAQKAVGEEKVKAAEEAVTGLEAIHKQFSDIFKGRKERLDTREAELGKMKDQNIGLALLQAGAAMMTTPGGLGMAIGKGAKVGSEQYAAGVDKLRSAQEKLMDARDRLEEIEAQRGELSARELFKARNEVKNVGIAVKEDMIKSNMQMYGVNRETAMKMVDNQVKVGIAQLEASSRARNLQLELLEKLGAAQPGSALAKGFEMSKQEGLIPRLYEQYTKQASDPLTGADFVRKFPTFEVYRAGMGGVNQPGINPTLPSNATVRAP